MTTIATFQIEIRAVDEPSGRVRRTTGDPMPSKKASDALYDAVQAAEAELRGKGFLLVGAGYGVTAKEYA